MWKQRSLPKISGWVWMVLPAVLGAADVTFTADVAPILNQRCVSCHRPGEIGPMPLRTYAEVRPWAKALAASVAKRRMPPWFADPHVGEFSNSRRLTDGEMETIAAWVKGGAKEGDPKKLPAAPVFAEGWAIGKPQVVVALAEEQVISPDGPDEYRKILVDPKLDRDLWVKAVEFRPGNRKVVHHAHVFVIPPVPVKKSGGGSPSPFVKEDGLQVIRPDAPVIDDGCSHPDGGYMIGKDRRDTQTLLASFVPGMSPDAYPKGVAQRVPKGSKFLFDIHYSKVTKKEERDRSSVGFVLMEEPPKVELERSEASNFYFAIPAGAAAHEVTACVTVPKDIELLSLLGHMHYRGKSFRIEAREPGGEWRVLLNVPRYDFEWQEMYRFAQPPRLGKGTVVKIVALFDNSANNAANPDPAKVVRWGEHTRTEMMDGWLEYVEAGKRQ